MLKVTKCTGNGQSSCKRCNGKGIWNIWWNSFLYKIEGYEGCYCYECTNEILLEDKNQQKEKYNVNL